MMAPALASRRLSADLRGAAGRALLTAALFALGYLVLRLALGSGDLINRAWRAAPSTMAMAAVLYVASHGVRILRLALLIGGWRVGLRDIAGFHLMTAAVSLAAPLKLGELYRVMELSRLTGGFLRAVIIAWCERAFDIAVILAMMVLALITIPGAGSQVAGVAAVASLFIAATATVFFLAPENLRRLSIFIIRRYENRNSVPALRALDATRRAILSAPALVRGKTASVAAMTVLIWSCEIGCFALLAPAVGGTLKTGLEQLLGFLSAVTTGQTLLDTLAQPSGASLLAYVIATQIPLVMLGLCAALLYAPRRLAPEPAPRP